MARLVPVVILGVVLLAGCSGLTAVTNDTPQSSTVTTTPTSSSAEPPDSPSGTEYQGAEPTGTGQPVPYELWLTNSGNEYYSVTVVFTGPNEQATFNKTFDMGADSSIRRNISFPSEGAYRVKIQNGRETTATHKYEVHSTNPETAVVIVVRDDGAFRVATFYH